MLSLRRRRRRAGRRLDDHLEAARLQRRQRRRRRRHPLRRHLGAQDPRELAAEMAHPALQPVPPVRGDHAGHQLDEPRPIGPQQREHQIRHARENSASTNMGAVGGIPPSPSQTLPRRTPPGEARLGPRDLRFPTAWRWRWARRPRGRPRRSCVPLGCLDRAARGADRVDQMAAAGAGARLAPLAGPARLDALAAAVGDRRVDRVVGARHDAAGGRPAEQRPAAHLADGAAIEHQPIAGLALAGDVPVAGRRLVVLGRRDAHQRAVRRPRRPDRRSRDHLGDAGRHPVVAVVLAAALARRRRVGLLRLARLLHLPPPPEVVEPVSLLSNRRSRQHHQPRHHAPHDLPVVLSFASASASACVFSFQFGIEPVIGSTAAEC